MRISPLGVFGSNRDLHHVAAWARPDAEITHIHPVCLQANALFTMAIAHAIRTGCEPRELWEPVRSWAQELPPEPALLHAIDHAPDARPSDHLTQQGWVVIAFWNALYQLLHAPNEEEGIIDTVIQGGDTDTNAAIAGALLGAVHGRDAVPQRWQACVLNCRPEAGRPDVHNPRPRRFWPIDALEIAEQLQSI